jgi:hypothetical protein
VGRHGRLGVRHPDPDVARTPELVGVAARHPEVVRVVDADAADTVLVGPVHRHNGRLARDDRAEPGSAVEGRGRAAVLDHFDFAVGVDVVRFDSPDEPGESAESVGVFSTCVRTHEDLGGQPCVGRADAVCLERRGRGLRRACALDLHLRWRGRCGGWRTGSRPSPPIR